MHIDDIVVDTLTFPITTGRRRSAGTPWRPSRRSGSSSAATPRCRRRWASRTPFGVNAAAWQVLNSVFLHECVNAGLDTAIVHASKILPMSKIPTSSAR